MPTERPSISRVTRSERSCECFRIPASSSRTRASMAFGRVLIWPNLDTTGPSSSISSNRSHKHSTTCSTWKCIESHLLATMSFTARRTPAWIGCHEERSRIVREIGLAIARCPCFNLPRTSVREVVRAARSCRWSNVRHCRRRMEVARTLWQVGPAAVRTIHEAMNRRKAHRFRDRADLLAST